MEKNNRPRQDSNLQPLDPKSNALPLRHEAFLLEWNSRMQVLKIYKKEEMFFSQPRWDLNPQSFDPESNALTIALRDRLT